ncbi:hypothetical protein ETU37_00440 [Nocardioides iriomotensis]|uniref:Uncharacterized protein n=1 Tax=Nocardioides iriomotensis TaxID=715784 RepID=A0A4Q5JA49_9ACTN|nr:hypothetical protein ETU37_00440 [Nocardioides iriomotensis]
MPLPAVSSLAPPSEVQPARTRAAQADPAAARISRWLRSSPSAMAPRSRRPMKGRLVEPTRAQPARIARRA